MKTVEIKGRIPQVPGPLIEAIQEADLELTKRFGKKCVANNCLKEEELNVIIGVV